VRRLAGILAATLALCGAATPAAWGGDVLVGIGDQSPDSLSDPLFKALDVNTTRIVLPWDVATKDPHALWGWAVTAQNEGLEPLLALGHSRGDACPRSPCALPSDDAYLDAFRMIRARYPWVREFTPWNEPNHASQPTAGDPAAAAHYANLMAGECPECTIVAGDMLDAPGMADYLARYKAALDFTPSAWSLHNYYDTNYFTSNGTRAFVNAVDGPVWLTESGGIVTWRSAGGQTQMPYDERRAAASVQWALDLARTYSDRVARLYVYQWRPGATDDFDAGLLRADGTTRPAYDVLLRALSHETVPADSAADPTVAPRGAVLAPAAAGPPAPRPSVALVSPRLDRAGRLGVTIACAVARCAGSLSLEGTGWAAERYVNGTLGARALQPRRARFAIDAGARVRVVLALPRRVVAIARRRGIAVKLTVVPEHPSEGWGARASARLRVPRR
jgi:hypothetical protein